MGEIKEHVLGVSRLYIELGVYIRSINPTTTTNIE